MKKIIQGNLLNRLYITVLLSVGILIIVSMGMLILEETITIEQELVLFLKEKNDDFYERTVNNVNVNIIDYADFLESDEIYIEEQQEPKEVIYNVNRADNKHLDGYLNSYVLDIIETYKGSYPYLLNDDYDNYNGVTTTLYFDDQVLLKAHPSGNRASHCSGITFEVFYRAMQRRNEHLGMSKNDFNDMDWDQLFDFVLNWYAAMGPKYESNITVAVEKYGMGVRIKNLEDARAGDFIDISRGNNTGHTAVFLNWVREKNTIIGLRYWSSQGSTGGINYNTEYFDVSKPDGKKYGNVIKSKVYIARISPVNQYRKNY